MPTILFKEESYKIIGACFEVYKQKGSGFTEPIYQECLQIELGIQGIPFVAQPALELEYKGRLLTQSFRPDFICHGQIVVEIKAVESLAGAHRSQALNYLNSTKCDLVLLINFGSHPKLEYERIVGSNFDRVEKSVSEEIESWNLSST